MNRGTVALLAILGIPFVCIGIAGALLQVQSWRIYHRIGDYSIGLVTFFTQLQYPRMNFPGPNMLEARIAAQPPEIQARIAGVRRGCRYLRWGILGYFGALLVIVLFAWKMLTGYPWAGSG